MARGLSPDSPGQRVHMIFLVQCIVSLFSKHQASKPWILQESHRDGSRSCRSLTGVETLDSGRDGKKFCGSSTEIETGNIGLSCECIEDNKESCFFCSGRRPPGIISRSVDTSDASNQT